MLFDVARYIRGCFETGVWRVLDHDQIIHSSDSQLSDCDALDRIQRGFSMGCRQYAAGRPHEAGLYWRMAFKNVEQAIRSTCYQNIYILVCQICRLRDNRYPELAKKLQEYLAEFVKSWYPPSHPTYSIYVALAAVDLSGVDELVEKIGLCFADLFEVTLGLRSYTTFASRLEAASRKWSRNPSTPPEQYLPDLVEVDANFTVCNVRSLRLLYIKANGLLARGFHVEAGLASRELIRRAALVPKNELDYGRSSAYYSFLAWYIMGYSQLRQGKDQAALEGLQTCLTWLDEAQVLFIRSGFHFIQAMVIKDLEELASRIGRQADAAKWHAQRCAIIRRLEEEEMEDLETT